MRTGQEFFMQEANREKNGQEQASSKAESIQQTQESLSEAQRKCRDIVRSLLQVFALLLALFAQLAWLVHIHPLLPLDIAITHTLQQNQAPWLRIAMLAISYPGSSPLLPCLVILTTAVFWAKGFRLEGVFMAGLSTISLLLNLLVKTEVSRPRPTGNLVHIIQAAWGYSFPSGHVMAYIAYWGLLFCFGIILFPRKHWQRTVLLAISAIFLVLIGPSRMYLGAHWASDVLGSYLLGGVLLGIAMTVYLPLKEHTMNADLSPVRDIRRKS